MSEDADWVWDWIPGMDYVVSYFAERGDAAAAIFIALLWAVICIACVITGVAYAWKTGWGEARTPLKIAVGGPSFTTANIFLAYPLIVDGIILPLIVLAALWVALSAWFGVYETRLIVGGIVLTVLMTMLFVDVFYGWGAFSRFPWEWW